MAADSRKARDLQLLDTIDAFAREPYEQDTWRVAREGRDSLQGGPSQSRWCNGTFDVLYTSSARDGALAEIHALLNEQPVFPSRVRSLIHRLRVRCSKMLILDDLSALANLGVEQSRYRERTYEKTQAIADAAYFLSFDGLVAPSARWDCMNCVLFTDRLAPADIELIHTEPIAIDWDEWRRNLRR